MKIERTSSRAASTLMLSFALSVAFSCTNILPAAADALSPNINEGDKVYSSEKPNSAYFGKGMTGRLNEASSLRFTGEHYISEGELDDAIQALNKAVQLEPDYPEGHVLLARAMTAKIKKTRSNLDLTLVKQALEEWQLISLHDAYYEDQLEARNNISAIKKLAKDTIKGQKKKGKLGKSLMAVKSFHFPW
jgi:hypothetical protein